MAVKQCQMMGWPATSKRGYRFATGQNRLKLFWLVGGLELVTTNLGDIKRERTKPGSSRRAADLKK